MPSQIVRQPNGLLAVFSTVVDDFTILDATEAEMRAEWTARIGIVEGNAKVDRGLRDEFIGVGPPAVPLRDDGLDRWRDCLHTVRIIHGAEQAAKREQAGSKPAVVVVEDDGCPD